MNLLLDTNVIIDYMGRQKPFFEDAEGIIAAGYFGDAKLWASAQSFKDAFYVLAHYVDSARVQDGILRLMEIISPVDLTGADVINAAKLKWDDFEECLIATCAAKAGAEYIITRDRKGFARSMAPIATPHEWLEQMRKERNVSFSAIGL